VFRRSLAAAAVAATAAAGLLVPAAPASAADPSVRLPLGQISDVVVDQAAGVVFLSGAHNDFIDDGFDGGVVVADLDGTNIRKVATATRVNGLALGADGRVYAADAAGRILAIDPASDMQVTPYSVAPADCPDSLAALGRRIWFSYGCSPSSSSGFGVLDPAAGTVTTGILAGTRLARSALAAVPGQPDQLVASMAVAGDPAVIGSAPTQADLSLLTVTDTTAVVTNHVDVSHAYDVAVSGDGAAAMIADGASGRRFSLPDLTDQAPTYTTPKQLATSIAVSPDGNYVAVGGDGGQGDEVGTFGADSGTTVRDYDTSTPGSANPGQSNEPAMHALAWTANHSLLAVYADYGDGYPTLKVLNSAIQALTSLSASGPSSKKRGSQLTISGQLTSHDAALAGGRLTVTRTDLAGTHTLPAVTTNGSGGYSFRDHPSVGSTNTYTVRYAGDATRAPSARTVHVAVSRATPSLSVTLKKSQYAFNSLATVHVHLGTTYNGKTVSIYARPLGFSKQLIRTARVDRHGNVSARIRLGVRTTFYASFAGDFRYAPRTVSTVRTVSAKVVSVLAKTKHHDGKYAVYGQRKGALFLAGVAPNKQGECLSFPFQRQTSSGWHTVANDCFDLDADSVTGVVASGDKHVHFRIRAEYHGDRANTKMIGNWHYFELS
jgi:hypothetical protein